MQRFLPIASLVLASTAVVAAFVPRDAAPPAVAPVAERAAANDDELDALRRRVDVIEDEQRVIWNRVVTLEKRAQGVVEGGASDGGAMPPALVAEVALLKQELRSVMQGEVLTDPAGRSAMKDVVREVQGEMVRERLAQRQQRQEARALEQKAKWKSFVTDARLTSQQEQTLTQRLEAEDAARKALFERGTPPEREELRTLRDQRRETDTLMLPMLDETQKTKYQELRQEDRGGGGGGDRPDRTDRPTRQRQPN